MKSEPIVIDLDSGTVLSPERQTIYLVRELALRCGANKQRSQTVVFRLEGMELRCRVQIVSAESKS